MPRGSAPGERRGGRQRGTPNKATAARQALIAEAGETPLDYLLSVMRSVTYEPATRIEAAKAAAPYVHPRLATVTHKGDQENPLRTINEILLRAVEPGHRE